MESGHEIQQAIETRRINTQQEEEPQARNIQQAVDHLIADEAERTIRDSGQDLMSENKDPAGKHYPFRILQANKYVERVVLEWFKNPANIERVGNHFRRPVSSNPKSHLLQWFLISTAHMPRPGTMSQGMSPDDKTKVIVWIALGKLGSDNGLLYEMESGQDMSLDGHEKITFSGKAGGLAVLLLLSM